MRRKLPIHCLDLCQLRHVVIGLWMLVLTTISSNAFARCGSIPLNSDVIDASVLINAKTASTLPVVRRVYEDGMVRISYLTPMKPCDGPGCDRQHETPDRSAGTTGLRLTSTIDIVISQTQCLTFNLPMLSRLSFTNETALCSELNELLRPPQV
jgi:hypothetical protein